MSRSNCCVGLVVAFLAAGCAVAPDEPTQSERSADAASDGARAATATTGSADEAQGAAAAPDLVVDLNKQPPTANSEVICRQMLRPGSNVIVDVCGTRPEWERYDREEARVSQELLIRMQNGRFR